MLHHTRALHFDCTRCGRCCHGSPWSYIAVQSTEIAAIRQALGCPEEDFRRAHLMRRVNGGWGIRILENGRCSLLGEDNRCRVYAVRPVQCQTYPYWPEILANHATWANEARRCEGINQGGIQSVEYIEQELQRSILAEEN